MFLCKPKKIFIFGYPGAGKSTYAHILAQKTGLPLFHLDKYFFTDNWQEVSKEQFLQQLNAMIAQPEWIIEGNCMDFLEPRFAHAELGIFIKANRLICLYRIFKRMYTKDPAIDDRATNCAERFSWKLVKYLWQFDRRYAGYIWTLRNKYPELKFKFTKR